MVDTRWHVWLSGFGAADGGSSRYPAKLPTKADPVRARQVSWRLCLVHTCQ